MCLTLAYVYLFQLLDSHTLKCFKFLKSLTQLLLRTLYILFYVSTQAYVGLLYPEVFMTSVCHFSWDPLDEIETSPQEVLRQVKTMHIKSNLPLWVEKGNWELGRYFLQTKITLCQSVGGTRMSKNDTIFSLVWK